MMVPSDARRRLGRRFFLIVLGMSAFHGFFLIADRRVPLGHETGRLFELQQAFAGGAVPEPGGAGSWIEQGTLLQNALLPISPALRGLRFLPLFHGGMFLEELLLLVGVWLLGSRFFRFPHSQFVVSVAALGSCLWIDHAAVNLLAFSALPLILHLLHEFLETRAGRALLMAGLLAILQILGRPPVFALLVPVAAALYWIGASFLFGYPLRDRLKELSWESKDVRGALLWLLPALAVLGGVLSRSSGSSAVVSTGGFSFAAVLAGAGLRNPVAYLDGLLGLSPDLDATCFCGYFTLAFAAVALGTLGLRSCLRLVAFVLATLLILGVLPLLFGMLLSIPCPTRPTLQGMPLLRLFGIFLAGFGCERMMELRALQAPLPRFPAFGLLLVSGFVAVFFVFNPFAESLILLTMDVLTRRTPAVAISPLPAQVLLFQDLAGTAALMAGLAGGALLLWSSGWRHAPVALALILILHPLDVFGWKFRMTWMKTCSLSQARASVQTLQRTPFTPDPNPPAPPLPLRPEQAYGTGPTRLRIMPQPNAVHLESVQGKGTRNPLRESCSWMIGILSIVMIGWTLRRAAALAGICRE